MEYNVNNAPIRYAKMFGILHVQVFLQLQREHNSSRYTNFFFFLIIKSEIKLYDSRVSINTKNDFFLLKKHSSGLSKKFWTICI